MIVITETDEGIIIFENLKNSKFFTVFVTCHHLHYFSDMKVKSCDNWMILRVFQTGYI